MEDKLKKKKKFWLFKVFRKGLMSLIFLKGGEIKEKGKGRKFLISLLFFVDNKKNVKDLLSNYVLLGKVIGKESVDLFLLFEDLKVVCYKDLLKIENLRCLLLDSV